MGSFQYLGCVLSKSKILFIFYVFINRNIFLFFVFEITLHDFHDMTIKNVLLRVLLIFYQLSDRSLLCEMSRNADQILSTVSCRQQTQMNRPLGRHFGRFAVLLTVSA
jgi:hypothetical protein